MTSRLSGNILSHVFTHYEPILLVHGDTHTEVSIVHAHTWPSPLRQDPADRLWAHNADTSAGAGAVLTST
jgi:hypothetical protein